MVRSVAEAVGLAHARGVLHRDLKPSNILVGERGEVFVLDWGLAKVLGGSAAELPLGAQPVRSSRADTGAPHTAMGQVAGTVGYMAPEQAEGRVDQLRPCSDVYALGAVLVRVLTGEEPWVDPGRLRHSLDLVRAAGRLPAELDALVRQAVALTPAERFEDGRALADALLAWLDGHRQREQARSLADRAEAALARQDAKTRLGVNAVLARMLDAEGRPVMRSVESVLGAAGARKALEALQAAGVVQQSGDDGLSLAEVGLVGAWPRLRSLAEDGQGCRNLARLSEAAREWGAQGRPPDHLARGAELSTLSTWAEAHAPLLAPLEREWLDAGRAAATQAARQRRRRVRLGGSIVLAAAVAMGALWIRAERALRETQAAREAAEQAEQLARGRRLLAEGRARQADGHDWEALALYRAAATLLDDDPEPLALVRELASTGRAVHQLPLLHGKLQSLKVSPDGRFVSTVSRGGTVRIHSLDDGRQVAQHSVGVWAEIRWLDDGRLSVATDSMVGFRLDPSTGAVEGPFGEGPAAPLMDIRPSDGRAVVAAPTGLRFADTAAVPHPSEARPSIGWFSADSRFLLTFAMEGGAQLHSGDDLRPLWHLVGPVGVKNLRYVGDDAVLMFTEASRDGAIWFYDLARRAPGVEVSALTGVLSTAAKVDARHDGQAIAYVSGSEVVLVDRGPGGLSHRWTVEVPGEDLLRVAFSPDGQWLAVASREGQLEVLHAATGTRLTRWRANNAGIAGLGWAPDGAALLSAGLDGRLQVWRPGLERLAGVLKCGEQPIADTVEVVRAGRDWVLRSDGQLCAAPDDGSLSGEAWAGRWSAASPGLEPGTLGAVSDGRPFVLDADGGATPVPFADADGAVALTADQAHDRWFLQSGIQAGAPLRADGTRDPTWKLSLGPITVLPEVDRLLVVPQQMGVQAPELLSLSSGEKVARLDIGARVDPTVGLVLDEQNAQALLLAPSGELHAFDLRTGAPRTGPTPPLEGSLALAGGGDSGRLVAASRNAQVRAWSLSAPAQPQWTVALDGEPLQIEVDADAGLVLMRAADATRALDLDSGALLASLPVAQELNLLGDGRVVLSPTGPLRRQVVWSLTDLPADPVAELGRRSNLRVCRGSHAVVPVVPFPHDESVWAPEAACVGAAEGR